MRLTTADALRRLAASPDKTFLTLFERGPLSVEIYRPKEQDLQQPHAQDEFYIIVSGHGIFQNGAEQHPFQPGDLLFVPAGQEHRFLEFSADFATWVIFC